MWGAPVFAASLLTAALIDDLRLTKVRNFWIVTFAIIALGLQGFVHHWDGLIAAGLGFSAALAMTLPLYLARALGGGDVKLLAVLGLGTSWQVVLSTAIYSLFWGALLGLFIALLKGELKKLLISTFQVLQAKAPSKTPSDAKAASLQHHRIPYTVALFFGWLTYMTLSGGFAL